ncbi:hypothetical protein BC830DRAFT_1088010 [Chytriomyces sp. MP71]|nr:hypothetical protein BC830DRAFT_1088010 [Chytriomyces sp. MP71]
MSGNSRMAMVMKTLNFTFWMTVSCAALSGVGYVVMRSTMGDEKKIATELGRSPQRPLTEDERLKNLAILDMIRDSRENANETPVWRK